MNKNLRLDLATVAGGALPGQESQGAVTGSLELAVLFNQKCQLAFSHFISVINNDKTCCRCCYKDRSQFAYTHFGGVGELGGW